MSVYLRFSQASSRVFTRWPRQQPGVLARTLSTSAKVSNDPGKYKRVLRSGGTPKGQKPTKTTGQFGGKTAHRKTGRNKQRRPPRETPPRKLILPELGLSSKQLAVLANVRDDLVFKSAKELDESTRNSATVLTPALIELVCEELNLNVEFSSQTLPLLQENQLSKESLHPRMPVVTVMGHVDHGKTSLLDALRKSDVADHEVGGITQNVAAFRVPIDGNSREEAHSQFATFIDTPGHAAFKSMRANGTIATDLVVLVVAADDGVMPQTVEAGNLARAANVPVIVAINKCDMPGADPERVRYQLLESLGINTEQLGGDVQCVDISAKNGTNLPQLLEAISLQAEMLDLKSDPSARGAGICLESRLDRAFGSVATVVVRSGTLKPGQHVVFQSPKALRGDLFGRIRSLIDINGTQLDVVEPGVAVGLIGLRDPIPPGAEFCVEVNEKAARAKSQEMLARNVEATVTIELANSLCAEREEKLADAAQVPPLLDSLGAPDSDTAVAEDDAVGRVIAIIVKGDVKGSADAVAQCVQAMEIARYPIRILEAGVGDVTEMDVKIASAPGRAKGNNEKAMIIAFNVRVKENEKRLAKRAGVVVLSHKLIYHLEDELKQELEKIYNLDRVVEEPVGSASVVRVFEEGRIAGCSVKDGELSIGDGARVLRLPDAKTGVTEPEVVFSGTIESIKHFAKAVRSVKKGSECGIGLMDWASFESGDIVQSVKDKQQRAGI